MFRLGKPTAESIQRFIDSQQQRAFSYPEVSGTSSEELPSGYRIDRYRTGLGRGRDTFQQALNALRSWRHFGLSWLEAHAPGEPEPGLVVALTARHALAWSLHACRVVYTFEDEDREGRRGGFAYGTLPTHAESGEERFEVRWDALSDLVEYRILAFSRPAHWLLWLGYPLSRRLQRRFGRESGEALRRAVRDLQRG